MITPPDSNAAALIGFGLLVASELIGMSPLKDNSLIQVVLRIGSIAFPYELKRKAKTPKRGRDAGAEPSRPRRARQAKSKAAP